MMSNAVLTDADKSTLKQQITAAIAAHHAWMGRLRTAAEYGRSSVDVATTQKEDACPIGIWLTRDISPSLKARPLYARSRTLHAQFHKEAARVLTLALARDPRAKTELAEGGRSHRSRASCATRSTTGSAKSAELLLAERLQLGEVAVEHVEVRPRC